MFKNLNEKIKIIFLIRHVSQAFLLHIPKSDDEKMMVEKQPQNHYRKREKQIHNTREFLDKRISVYTRKRRKKRRKKS